MRLKALFAALCFILVVVARREFVTARSFFEKRSTSTARNLRARYELRENAIYVEWEPTARDTKYNLRYKLNQRSSSRGYDSYDYGNGDGQWNLVSAQSYGSDGASLFARVQAEFFGNNDELLVQVKPEEADEWGDTLIISIAKHSPNERVENNDGGDGGNGSNGERMNEEAEELEAPRNFTANILASDAIRLEWTRSVSEANAPGLYYMVDIRQTTANDPMRAAIDKQIKVESDNFFLGDLTPGEHYEMTIRSATGPNRVSSTAAIVQIGLPQKDEFFEVGNLVISSRFKTDGSGVVNLTWEIPPSLHGKIDSYDVQYAVNYGGDVEQRWHRILFPGHSPTVLLHELKSDTEYLLKIKTKLSNGLETESGEFKFRTPRVPANPLEKVNVIHSSESSAIRLQWTLASHMNPQRIAGYDIYLSDDKDAPDSQWRFFPLNSDEMEISLPDLRPAHVYYAKIKVRQADGALIDSPLIYKFTSTDSGTDARFRRDGLFSASQANQRMRVNWSYPNDIAADVIGAKVFYADQPSAPIPLWQRLSVDDRNQRSAVLTGLHEDTVYHVQIVPVRSDGSLDFQNADSFQIRTD